MRNDPSLSNFRDLADRNLNGYTWKDGLLMHVSLDPDNTEIQRIVLPKCRRQNVLRLAHDNTAHVGCRGMRKIIGQRFTWPGVYVDIVAYVKSCSVCLRMNSTGNKKVKIVERGIVSVPFETVAVDLVGPLPKGKRGARYLFTCICLATRWPEAVPMHTASAREAAQCFIEIVSRTGIPSKVLSDRGTVFLSKLMAGACEMLGIDSLATSPCRPQSNGVVERLHGTLQPMLAKAVNSGVDWVDFLPLALFAFRQVPSRVPGYSPHKLVYGKEVVGPLDVLYSGWVDCKFECMDTEEWLVSLHDRLSVIHYLAVGNESKSVEERVLAFNKGKSDRELSVGDTVLMRIPGIHGSLQASWEGPYIVSSKVSRVTYKVSKGDGCAEKLAHINNLKVCQERPLSVNAITLVAEEQGIDEQLLLPKAVLGEENVLTTMNVNSGMC